MRTLPTTFLQIFCKIILISRVTVKSIFDTDADEELLSSNGLNRCMLAIDSFQSSIILHAIHI